MSDAMQRAEPHPQGSPVINGIALETLQGTVQAVKQQPDLGQCRFRARNKWLGGAHNRTTIEGFYGAGQEMEHKRDYTFDADEPPILAGNDEGANPVEHLLNALAACVTTSMVAHAAVRGIHIEEVESHVEGDIDLRGFLGLSDKVPKGFSEIRIEFRVKADEADIEKLRELTLYSPVYNTITQGTPVEIDITKA